MNRFVLVLMLLSLANACSGPTTPDLDMYLGDDPGISGVTVTGIHLRSSPDGSAVLVSATLSPDTDLSRFGCASRLNAVVRGPKGAVARIVLVPDSWDLLICDELIVIAESNDDVARLRRSVNALPGVWTDIRICNEIGACEASSENKGTIRLLSGQDVVAVAQKVSAWPGVASAFPNGHIPYAGDPAYSVGRSDPPVMRGGVLIEDNAAGGIGVPPGEAISVEYVQPTGEVLKVEYTF